MKIAITDANIFIDVIFINIHLLLVRIDLEIYTTQNVLDELDDKQNELLQPLIDNGVLIVYSFSNEDAKEFEDFFIRKGLSMADHSVIFIAEKLNAMVVSGDSLLRNTCKLRKLEVHGILWILDKCIHFKYLTNKEAHGKLTALMKYNPRLPMEDCEVRLQKWK